MQVIVESFLYSDHPTPEREENKKMYRNDAFEKIAYIMKNTDRKDKTWPNFAKMAKSMGCCKLSQIKKSDYSD